MSTPIIHHANEGHQVELAGIKLFVKAAKEHTNGSWSLIEYHAPAQFAGPPPHSHKIMEETFYVLEGNPSFRVGDEIITGAAGSFIHIPVGTVHTFSNLSDSPAKFLVHMSPGGFEKYFDELVAIFKEEEKWPPSDMGKLTQLFAKYDTYLPDKR